MVVILATAPFVLHAQSNLVFCEPPGAGSSGTPCDFSGLIVLVNKLISYCLYLGTSIFSIVFMWAGWLYITARGNTSQIGKAHGLFWNAIVGFVIMLSAWLIIDFILKSLVQNSSSYRLLSPR